MVVKFWVNFEDRERRTPLQDRQRLQSIELCGLLPMNELPATPSTPRSWPGYRTVWRWHFYAGLVCLPFVVILSFSGVVYLFKPQIEAWSDREFDSLVIEGPSASVADQVRAALTAFPNSVPSGYELPTTARSAARVIVRQNGEAIRVYVHPRSLAILHSIPEKDRFMKWVSRLHGELLMGDWGSHVVELAASWTIIMILTGLFLWWPRQSNGWGGIVYPRLRMGSRICWKDLHSVTGVWISSLAMFLLLSGLPWATFWGGYFKAVRQSTGTAAVQQDWATGSGRLKSSRPESDSGGEHSGHGGGSKRGSNAAMPKDMAAFDRVVATVLPLALDHPVVISPPARDAGDWTAKSNTPNRPRRVSLTLNGTTGQIVTREDFRDRHLIDRIVGTGIAAHEGQLFGWLNQLLGLATAGGLVLLSVSGAIMWWRRRDQGVLGAPRVSLDPRASYSLIALVIILGICLPLFGASLLLVQLLEWGVLRRIPGVSRWLGLSVSEA